MLQSFYRLLPEDPGIYLFLDEKGSVLYVGKAKNLKNRVSSYFIKSTEHGTKTKLLVEKIKSVKYIPVQSEIESLLLEANYIKKLQPLYNVRLTDGKAYPLIRITVKNTYPAVLTARHKNDTNSLYFGPYPNVSNLHLVLRTLRRIFPYQSVLNHSNKICLYYYLGLCPCPGVFNSNGAIKQYKKTIRRIITFLNGNIKTVIKDLEKEREAASKKEDYEEAKKIQKKIDAITLITNPVRKPFEYETNPNLAEDLRETEQNELVIALQKKGIAIKSAQRIECFDISNFQGTNATGSMVTFLNGKHDKAFYRRFRVRGKGPNDFAMMHEVLQRRIQHAEWGMPNLIIVDGGKGQISSAKKAIKEHGINIPIIGLAKREEKIITENFQEIRLPKNSPALHLIIRIRDEAHRFAITYHRKLRSKLTFS